MSYDCDITFGGSKVRTYGKLQSTIRNRSGSSSFSTTSSKPSRSEVLVGVASTVGIVIGSSHTLESTFQQLDDLGLGYPVCPGPMHYND